VQASALAGTVGVAPVTVRGDDDPVGAEDEADEPDEAPEDDAGAEADDDVLAGGTEDDDDPPDEHPAAATTAAPAASAPPSLSTDQAEPDINQSSPSERRQVPVCRSSLECGCLTTPTPPKTTDCERRLRAITPRPERGSNAV